MSETVSEMLLWLLFAAMTASVVVAILRPLGRRFEAEADGREVDLYKDQLAEVARDLERGLIDPAEAEAAKVEVSRRLIAAADALEKREAAAGSRRSSIRRATAAAIMLAVPALALATYLALGSPGLPDEPFAARMAAPVDKLPLDALVLRVEQHLKQDPKDLRGWEVLGPAYIRQQRYADAVNAWTQAIAVGGEDAGRLAARGEAEALAAGGVVVPAAREDFARAAKLDPTEPRAQYYLGVADVEDGRKDAAIKRWKALLASAPKGAPWRASVAEELAGLENPAASAPSPGPTADQMGAAANMSPEARQQMIETMVGRLASRLETSPRDLQGWLRLIRAYGVLGKRAEADAALAKARTTFADDKAALASLDDAEQALPPK